MDSFYDGDLKDIWDSDLDPTDSLKINSDHDMQDWFLYRDVKDPTVILNDKLISDALLNGTLPIKTEHSYSLNSDGDSLPDSPKSLQAKIDDMDDECYPAISLKTATSMRATIDPKCLTLHPPATNGLAGTAATAAEAAGAGTATVATGGNAGSADTVVPAFVHSSSFSLDNPKTQHHHPHLHHRQLHHHHHGGSGVGVNGLDLQLPHQLSTMYDNDCSSSISSAREGSISPDFCSDIELDEAAIKDEPMSPESSCPASPKSHSDASQPLSLDFAHMQTELLFETSKHSGLLLGSSGNAQNLMKSQLQQHQLLLTSSSNLILPKIAIKSEKQHGSTGGKTQGGSGGGAYGIPLTPPSSLPSDDSEGNLSPEHLFSPMSPNASVSISVANIASTTSAETVSTITRRTGGAHAAASRQAAANGGNASTSTANTTTTTTRQPIHTPLISSQPKGSTGTLLLTEEEKRTLLAEGYPIPQKLPLTKAEEKSLKKIRRKIKNKISAQESRRKKKEYMDQLERRVEILVTENHDYKKRVESLEQSNANLLSQLHKLQALVKHNVKKS